MDLVEALKMPDKTQAVRDVEAKLMAMEAEAKQLVDLRDALRIIAKMPAGRPFMATKGSMRTCANPDCGVEFWTGGSGRQTYANRRVCSAKCRMHINRRYSNAKPRP